MTQITVTELNKGTIKISNTDITIQITDDKVTILVYNVPIVSANMPELKPTDIIGYVDGWFNCIAVVPSNEGTTADIKPILTIPHWLNEFCGDIWDARNSIACGAYSRLSGIEYWTHIWRDHVTREIIEQIL